MSRSVCLGAAGEMCLLCALFELVLNRRVSNGAQCILIDFRPLSALKLLKESMSTELIFTQEQAPLGLNRSDWVRNSGFND